MQEVDRQYKIKRETTHNKTGEAFALTVPRGIQEQFKDVKFTIEVTKDTIIYKSGIDLKQLKEDIKSVSFEQL